MTHAEKCVMDSANTALDLLRQGRPTIDDIEKVREYLTDIVNVTRYADEINCVSEEYISDKELASFESSIGM